MMKRQSDLVGDYKREIRRGFPAISHSICGWSVPNGKVTDKQCITNDLWVQNLRSTGI